MLLENVSFVLSAQTSQDMFKLKTGKHFIGQHFIGHSVRTGWTKNIGMTKKNLTCLKILFAEYVAEHT